VLLSNGNIFKEDKHMAGFRKPDCICKDKKKCKCGAEWEYRIRYKEPRTQKFKETSKRGFKTKKEAELAAAKVEMEIANNTFIVDSSITYQQVYDEWWDSHSKTIKPSSRYTSKIKYTKYSLPFFGLMPIKDITKKHCQEFVDELTKKIKSVGEYKMYANRVFKYAVGEGYIIKNPMDNVIIPKRDEEFLAEEDEEDTERKFWEKDELNKFLLLSKKHMSRLDYMMFYLKINLGLRKGENLALMWKDIDFEKDSITIRRTLYFEKGKEILQKVKNYESRTLFVDGDVIKELKKWQIQQRESFLEKGIEKSKIVYVLSREDLRPLRLAYPNDVLNNFIKQHEFHRITVHGLRHTHASLLFEAGATIPEVQEQLGHKDEKTTMRIYIHVTKKNKESLPGRFRDYLNS
jgi:integrase